MKQLKYWFIAFFKRILCMKRMWAAFLLFPLLCGAIRAYTGTGTPLIRVALFQEDSSALAGETIRELTESDSIISFYEVTSESQLIQDVENTSAECGYIFTSRYQQENLLDQGAWKKSIQAVQNPASTLTGSVDELVFSVFFQHYNQELLRQYLTDDTVLDSHSDSVAVMRDIDSLFAQHATDKSSFSFADNNSLSGLDAPDSAGQDIFLSNACRGILGVLLLLCAMCGGFYLGNDKKTLFVMPMHPRIRLCAQLLDITVPVLAMAIPGILGIALLPSHRNLISEALALAIYCINLSMFVYLIRTYVRSSASFSVMIVFITLCTLVLSPVFIDASVYIRLLCIPKYLLPATYYLEAVTAGATGFVRLCVITAVLCIIVHVVSRLPFRHATGSFLRTHGNKKSPR